MDNNDCGQDQEDNKGDIAPGMVVRMGMKKTIVATARKLAVIMTRN
jgi:hypothetical protein